MDTLYDPTEDVYRILTGITGITVLEPRSTLEVESLYTSDTPIVIPVDSNNMPSYSLDSQITKQDVEITIDIYARTPAISRQTLQTIESTMRANDFMLNYSRTVSNVDDISHKQAYFNLLN